MLRKFVSNMSFRKRMLVSILGTVLLIFIITIEIVNQLLGTLSHEQSVAIAKHISKESANIIKKDLDEKLNTLRTLAQSFQVYSNYPFDKWKSTLVQVYKNVFENNPSFFKLWDSWELSAVDSTYKKDYGRFSITYYRDKKEIKCDSSYKSLDGDGLEYAKLKHEARESILEPYWDMFVEKGQEKKFMTSISSPIKQKGKYVGVVAADITMDEFHGRLSKLKPFENSYMFLITNEGTFVSQPQPEMIGKKVSDYVPQLDIDYKISDRIKKGEDFEIIVEDPFLKEKSLVVFSSIQIGETANNWCVGVSIPMKIINKEVSRSLFICIIVAVAGIIILVILIYAISKNTEKYLNQVTERLRKMSKGEVHFLKKMSFKRRDEIGIMAESLNLLMDNTLQISYFAEEIGNGNFEKEIHTLGQQDMLGNALINMRDKLLIAKKEEDINAKRTATQKWMSEGIIALNDILQQNNEIKQISFKLISYLVNYINANQGTLFLLNDTNKDDIYYETAYAIAYDRKRYLQRQVREGEGLVGQAIYEKKVVHLTDIPDNYIEITSGMGTANPRSLVIVPAVMEGVVYGVFEIASFSEIKDYHIELIEKIGQNLASNISALQINEKTNRLLDSYIRQKEELTAQEEELRQNIEELKATKEEQDKKDSEINNFINAVEQIIVIIEYDLSGKIVYIGQKAAQLLNKKTAQLVGTFHRDGFVYKNYTPEQYSAFWTNILNGNVESKIINVSDNKNILILDSYSVIYDNTRTPYKVLRICVDVSTEMNIAKKYDSIVKEISILQQKLNSKNSEIDTLRQELDAKANKLKKKSKTVADTPDENNTKKTTPKTVKKEVAPVVVLSDLIKDGKNFIEISEEMLVKIDEIDEQHKRIVFLVNKLFNVLNTDKTKKEIKEASKNLLDFITYHFNFEEQRFKQFGYKQEAAHVAEHKELTDKINDFQNQILSDEKTDESAFMLFLKNWILKHFSVTDQNYVQLFTDNKL